MSEQSKQITTGQVINRAQPPNDPVQPCYFISIQAISTHALSQRKIKSRLGRIFHASLLTVREIVHNRGMGMRGEEL